MPYSTIGATQFVSRANLQDAVTNSIFVLNASQTIPGGNRHVTKQDALTYLNINASNVYLAPKTSLQLIAKRDLTSNVVGADPATAILSLTNYTEGLFIFNLSVPIPSTNIVISEAQVNGEVAYTCTGATTQSDTITIANPATIVAGTIFTSRSGNTPMGCSINAFTFTNTLKVNGTNLVNGATITIGATLVTIYIELGCLDGYAC